MFDETQRPLADQLALLERLNLVRRRLPAAEAEYFFRHALVQDVAYDTVLRVDRHRLHRAAAETLERLYPDRIHELAPELSRHFREAGERQPALKYAALAGAAALANFANAEAEGYYRDALNLAETSVECAPLLAQLGEALVSQSRFDEAIENWRAAIEAYQAMGDFNRVAQLYARAARAAGGGGMAGNMLRALELIWDGLDAMAGRPESPGLAALLHEAGRACYFTGIYDDAREYCQQAVEMAERLGDIATQADAMATLWGTMLHPVEESVAGLYRAIELGKAADHHHALSRAYHNLGNLLGFVQGHLQAGIEEQVRAADVDHMCGHHAEEFYSLRVATGMAWLAGDLPRVQAIVARQRRLVDLIPEPRREIVHMKYMDVSLPWIAGDLAEARRRLGDLLVEELPFGDRIGAADLLIELGDIDRADDLLCQGLQSDGEMVGVVMRTQLSVVRARQGNAAEARRLLEDARQVVSEYGLMDQMYLATAEVQLAVAEGRWEDAFAAYDALVALQARAGMRWYEARSLREWAEAHLARGTAGDQERAVELLGRAQQIYEELTLPLYAARLKMQRMELAASISVS